MARFIGFVAAALLVTGAESNAATMPACEPLHPDAASVAGGMTRGAAGRAVALISINGQGPFRFIVDTGANRSVLSQGLAARLGLAPAGVGVVHSIDGADSAMLVNVESISLGALRLSRGDTPVLDGPMLGGEDGLLGVDGMAGRLLYFDFTKHCVKVYESAAQMRMKGWRGASARMRFGSLLMVPGHIVGVRVNVLLDTGSDISLANQKYRDALRRIAARTIQYHDGRAFTFGRPIVLEQSVWTPSLRLGHTVIGGGVTTYIGDFYLFDFLGVQDEPTMLIGMDVLARLREMAIDFERGVVYFRKGRGER
jgi:hypothetical protein